MKRLGLNLALMLALVLSALAGMGQDQDIVVGKVLPGTGIPKAGQAFPFTLEINIRMSFPRARYRP